MSDSHFSRVRSVFEEAIALAPGERHGYLTRTCGADTDLRAEVEALLREDSELSSRDDPFLRSRVPLDAGSGAGAGATLGRFKIGARIASGGMGAVYEATQDEPRRKVALKILRASLATDGAIQRFRQESEILARLRHPAIAQVFDAGADARGNPWFAMELVEGALPITEYAERRGLEARARVELMARVCAAIQHGHQRGVLHRDLKPSNLLVDTEGNPKVIDFGIARFADPATGEIPIETQQGQFLGTLHYMAPEQCAGDPRDVDTRADTYSLGVVLYELLAGRLPHDFDGKPWPDAVRALVEGDAKPIASVNPNIPRELAWVVHRALERDRDRRYASTAELGEDLWRWLRGDAVTAGPSGAAYRIRVFARRHRGLVAGAALAVVALVIGVVGLGLGLAHATDANEKVTRHLEAETEAKRLAQERADQQESMLRFLREILSPGDPTDDEESGGIEARLAAGLEELERAFPGRPDVIATMRGTLGAVCAGLGFLSQAEPALRVALQQLRATKGDDHPDTLRAASHLAATHLRSGRHAEAANLYRLVRDGWGRTSGVASAAYRAAQQSLWVALRGAGPWSEVDATFAELHSPGRDGSPANTMALAYVRLEVEQASYLSHQGRGAEAEAVIRPATERLRDVRPEERKVFEAMRSLAKALAAQGRVEEAEAAIAPCVETMRRTKGGWLPITEMTRAEVLLARGDDAGAEAAAQSVVASQERARRLTTYGTLNALAIRARALHKLGRGREAVETLRTFLERAPKGIGTHHPLTLAGTLDLVELLREAGEVDEARTLLADAADRILEAGGDGCPLARRAAALAR